ncbi:hypothetical protein H8S20_16705 [Clostridium sp. NSJ-6]|uniref:Uncharacterized protein n=1 Tax=Clostridium hominis TaxID=2763036 RepID=A0ABR7DH98_9CLOT|nr:hypothetical protein [Clostridium hominis]MBC5630500.1 hypothetical protein [Clostridium hominis]
MALEKFLDKANYDILMSKLEKKQLLSLISGNLINRIHVTNEERDLQDGLLSILLVNIMLD